MLVRGDSNGRVYPEKPFKVVGIYAAYVLADSAFARLDHGTGVQHIRLKCLCTASSQHLHNTRCMPTAYTLHTHTHAHCQDAPVHTHNLHRRAAAQGSTCPHVGGARRRRGSR